MSKINARKIKEIRNRASQAKKDLDGNDVEHFRINLVGLIGDVNLMLGLIEEIRTSVHFAEDEGVISYIAELLGTNCQHDKGIDEES
jgi:hypothetical protein